MICAPCNESPVGPMPKTTHKEDDECVSYDFSLAHTAAAQGNIDIIPKPSRQGDVPPAPKLRYVATEIGYIEVAHQLDAEEFGRAYGNVRVARKIAVNLEGEEDGGEKQGATALFCVGRENLVHIDSTIVGHNNFLE